MRAVRTICLVLLLLCCGCRRKLSEPAVLLHRAVNKADLKQIRSLLASGADVNARDEQGLTPLHVAARVGHKRMVDLLVAHGADVNANDAHHGTPLHCAAQWGHYNVIKSLIGAGADVTIRGSWQKLTPLQMTLGRKDTRMAALLLAAGADTNLSDQWGRKVLHDVALGGLTDFADLFLAHGASVNAKDREGLTALHEAVWENHREMVQLLLARGADVNSRDLYGQTPLHVAAIIRDEESSELLTREGADSHVKDDRGLTPLDYMRLPAVEPMVKLHVDGRSPYSVIVANPSVVRKFLRGEEIEFDRLWIPEAKDIEGIDLRAAIEASPHIETKTWFDLDYILGHLQEYNREYAGFIREGREYILCNMDWDEFDREPHNGRFSWGFDGGCSLARVVIDSAGKVVVRIDCNGN